MKECSPNETPPAPAASLVLDAKVEPWDERHWDCASIVRMQLHPSNNTGQDVMFVVSGALHIHKSHMQEQSSASFVVLQEPQTRESL